MWLLLLARAQGDSLEYVTLAGAVATGDHEVIVPALDGCKACNVSFSVDFSRAIELAFRASSEIRDVETQTFCIGGPAHFPHVAAQVRLAPGERFALALALGPGFYLLRSPQPRAATSCASRHRAASGGSTSNSASAPTSRR